MCRAKFKFDQCRINVEYPRFSCVRLGRFYCKNSTRAYHIPSKIHIIVAVLSDVDFSCSPTKQKRNLSPTEEPKIITQKKRKFLPTERYRVAFLQFFGYFFVLLRHHRVFHNPVYKILFPSYLSPLRKSKINLISVSVFLSMLFYPSDSRTYRKLRPSSETWRLFIHQINVTYILILFVRISVQFLLIYNLEKILFHCNLRITRPQCRRSDFQ